MLIPAWLLNERHFPGICAPIPGYRDGIEGVTDTLADLGIDQETAYGILEILEDDLRQQILATEENKIRDEVEKIVLNEIRDKISEDWLCWLQDRIAEPDNQFPSEIREFLVEL